MVATPSPTPTGPGAASVAILKAALLTVQDFRTGWKSKPVTDSKSKSSGDCGDKLEAFDKAHPDSKIKAEADFEKDSDEVDEELQGYSDVADLKAQLAEYIQIIRGCRTLTLTNGGEKINLQVSELSFPKLGDESFGYSATGKSQGVTIVLNLAVILRGHVLVQFTQAGIISADADDLAATATKALAKLDTVVSVQ